MQIAICSYSFHRLLAAGKQDIFGFITDCKKLGCTHLDPWNGHLEKLRDGDKNVPPGKDPGKSGHLSPPEEDYIQQIRQAGDRAKLPFGTVAVDGAHIYEPTAEARAANGARAYRWIEIAGKLGAKQMRIDAGGPEEMPDDVFQIIKDGYRDVIDRARARGIEVIVENHWGPTKLPDNVIKLLENIPGLGYLLDTHNWRPDKRDEGRRRCAKYATATHIKTLNWDAAGNEVGEDVPAAINLLLAAGYKGIWGIESCPAAGDEYAAAERSVALLKKFVKQ